MSLYIPSVSWAPVVFHSFFGRWHTMGPFACSTLIELAANLALLVQAVKYPSVPQEEEEDE